MSINNCTNLEVDIAKLREDFFQQQNDQIPDPSVIAAMANVYFPEFGHGEKSVPLENGVPTVDFINAIPVAIEEELRKESPAISQEQSQPFDFLGEVRPIFTECENTADKHRNIASNEMIERDTTIDFGMGIYPEVCMQSSPIDVQAIRKDFPILEEQVNGKSLIWFDNAATTQKPKCVIERLAYFYQHENSNIHRAAHTLAARATDAYEEARDKVKMFLHAASSKEIVFVRGATEAINLVAQSLGKYQLQKDDEIIVSMLEHHANIVPWQMLCLETGARLRVIPVDESGQILLPAYEKLLNAKTKIVAVAHVSNALGTVTPVKEIVKMAHQYGAKVLIDGAQAVSHMQVDVQELDCDFYAFSGHKIYGPTGIGVLYGKSEILSAMHPYQGGGNMIADVTFEKTLYRESPSRFEAGTGNIADAVGLSAALDYVLSIGMDRIHRYEHDLISYSMHALQCVPKLRLIGTAEDKAGVISFVIDGLTATDIGKALSEEGIAVRAGHHCAQPILRRFGLEATVRASLAFYNTRKEVDALVAVLCKL